MSPSRPTSALVLLLATAALVAVPPALGAPAGPGAAAAEKSAPANMRPNALLLFVRTEEAELDSPRSRRTLRLHDEWLNRLEANERSLLAGPVEGDERLHSAVVMPWADLEGARRFAQASPAVGAGLLAVEAHPWLAEWDRVDPMTARGPREAHVLGLLVRGPGFVPGSTDELRELGRRHVAHLESMAEHDGLVLAGPFVDGGERRGGLVFKGTTMDAARLRAEEDPAVEAGRFRLRTYTWWLPAQSWGSDAGAPSTTQQ